MILVDVNNVRLLKATIANGEFKGRTVLIPKTMMQPADESVFGFEWQRMQFPVRVAFAMTIHKSQGQTLKMAGVWLRTPVFSHGQLYVACSRVSHPSQLKFAIPNNSEGATNVVYHEVLLKQ